MKIKMQGSAIEDPEIKFVSLVKRGANREPFKIVKSEQGTLDMLREKVAKLFGLEKGLVEKVEGSTVNTEHGAEGTQGDDMKVAKLTEAQAGDLDGLLVQKEDGAVCKGCGGPLNAEGMCEKCEASMKAEEETPEEKKKRLEAEAAAAAAEEEKGGDKGGGKPPWLKSDEPSAELISMTKAIETMTALMTANSARLEAFEKALVEKKEEVKKSEVKKTVLRPVAADLDETFATPGMAVGRNGIRKSDAGKDVWAGLIPDFDDLTNGSIPRD